MFVIKICQRAFIKDVFLAAAVKISRGDKRKVFVEV